MWGPGRNNWNISIFKTFSGIPIGTKEGAQLQFRAEFFNAFNHTQYHGIETSVLSDVFGQVTTTYDARTIQFGLKFAF